MDKKTFIETCLQYYDTSTLKYIPEDKALSDELIRVKIFDEPIIKMADVSDDIFTSFKHKNIIGDHFRLPTEWLNGAKTVVSFFFPFTETIRDGNKLDMNHPSKGWLNGRIEGQFFIDNYISDVINFINEQGFNAIAPSLDKNFYSTHKFGGDNKIFTSNWSERHIAYACGIGTFSLSSGLITEKGVAGRVASVVTDLYIPSNKRDFQRFDQNCIMCGKCIKNCPVNAISFEHGKNHLLCSNFLDSIEAKHNPRYGCGKCQVNVPCEAKNPAV